MLPLPRGAVWQLLFLFCAALYINGVRSDGRVVCYYTNWSVYRPGTAKFNPQNINPYLCTHLIYAFGGFTKDNQMKPFDKYQDIEQGGYAKFTGLKTYNKQLKTMIAIGGWNEASSRFSPLVANAERRQKFIKNILKFLRQNHFDGIDLDWEYPAHREGGKPRDRDNYAQFVQELRAEFERESEKTGRPRLLLTMAVPAGIEYIEKGYDIPKLNKYLDWFNLLTYDFHSSHEPSVNHHAPLYSLEEESEYNYDAELNIDYSIKFYLNAGADRDKLVLGIPTYGRSYTLINEESTEIGAPAEAPGEQGDATREKGYLAYYEICQNVKEDPEWTVVQPNPNAMGPYAYRRNQWVGYDDEAIVRKKAQYVVENGLGGIMFWAIDNDDFRGICTGKQYPLIEAAKEAMLDALGFGINEVSKPSAPQKPSRSRSRENSASTRNRITTTEHKLTYAERKGSTKRVQTAQQSSNRSKQQQPSTTEAPIKLTEVEGSSLYIGGRTTTPPPPTTPDPGTDFKCEEEGFFQHPRDCKKYYWCLDSGPSGLGIVAHQFTCPSGLYFNPAADSCDFARNVPCKTKKSTTAAPITTPATTTTTTPRPNRLTAATSRPTTFFRTTPRTTTTTTTEASEEDIEYEEEENSAPSPFAKRKGSDKDAEEDPQVIKELIELIRKVGGIEELEKHLLRKEDGTISIKENSSSSSSSSLTATTPSTISKSLYEKVLSKPNALNSFRNRFTSTSSFRTTKTQTKTQDNAAAEVEIEETHETDNKSSGATTGFSKYSSVLRGNSRQGPQNEGISKLSEFDGFLKEKKQYITINRNRGTKKTSDVEEDEEVDEEEVSKTKSDSLTQEEEEEYDVKTTRKVFSSATPSYSTIRRTRPSTTTESNNDEAEDAEEKEVTERKSYSTLNRSRSRATTTTETPDVVEVTAGSTRYKYLERTRPTRPTTESSNKIVEEEATVNTEDEDDDEAKNKENTVHFKAVNIENTRETQQQKEITTNTQRTYASIGRRTTTSTPDTETTTAGAAKTSTSTTTAAPTTTRTTSTTETPITTPLTIIETTTPDSILLTTNIPITTTTNPTTISTTTTTITTTTTKTTTLPNGEDVLGTSNTTPVPNDINSDISETLDSSLHLNSLLTESSTSSTTPTPTTESGLDTNEQEIDSHSTTTEATTATVLNGNDKLTKTADTEEHEEVNLVSKQRNKTVYNTRTRTTSTTTKTLPTTTTTTTNSDIETTTTTSPTNAKKTLGVRRQQQILLNRSSQTKTITTDTPNTTTESVNNDFLGTVSSPRPFGFPKRRTRPSINAAGTTTTSAIPNTTDEEVVKSTEESLITKQKASTKLNAAANSQTKKYQFQRRTTTTKATTTTRTTTTTEKPTAYKKEEDYAAVAKTQVNVNEGNENESEISTNIPEKTTAPTTTTTTTTTTTKSPSSPAAPLTRRLKVLKLKRPVVSSSNNTNITGTTTITTTATANDSSATNLNASHTDTQNIVKLSSVSDVDTQIVKTQTLTQTEITDTIDTHSAKPLQISPTPKRFRKVIRKLIRPVNRTSEITNHETQEVDKVANTIQSATPTTSTTFLQRRQNTTRYGFNRSSKQYNSRTESKTHAENHDSSEEDEEEEELVDDTKAEQGLSSLLIRGRNKFTLPGSVTSTTKSSLFGSTNRNRFSNRLQSVTTITDSAKHSVEDSEEEEDEDEGDIEDEVTETVAKTFTSKPTTKSSLLGAVNRNRFSNRLQTLTTTTEKTKASEQSSEDEDDDDDDDEDEVTENVQHTLTRKPTVKSNLFEAKLQTVTTTTTENTKALEPHSSEDEDDDDNDEEDDEEENKVTENIQQIATTVESHTEANLSTTSATTENIAQLKEESTTPSEVESTTEIVSTTTETPANRPLNLEKLRNKVKTDQTIQQDEGTINERLKLFKSSNNNESQTDDPLLKLRNKVKQDLAKGSQEEKGVLSTRFKSSQSTEQPHEKDDPLLKLRNKVKQDLAKGNQIEGVLTERFNSSKSNTEVDDPLLKLRNKVKQELAKGEHEEGVVNLKLKKLLETKNTTSGVHYKVEETEHETTTNQESLNLQKIRDKVQTNLAKNDQDQGVVSSRLKKLLSEKTTSTNIKSNGVEEEEDAESSTELKESSGDGDLLETNKLVTTKRPFAPKTKLTLEHTETQTDEIEESVTTTTSAPRTKPTFRRKLVAKRPYTPTKPPLSALRTTTVKIPTTKGKNKYVRRKFGRFHPFNASNRNTGEGFIRKDPRGNILPGTDRFKVEGSAGGQSGDGEDYEEYDEEDEDEGNDEEEEQEVEKEEIKPVQAIKPVINRPPGLFNRPHVTILKKPTEQSSKEQSSAEEEEEEDETDDEEEEDEDEEELEKEKEDDSETVGKIEEFPIAHPTYKPKDNRIPPGARPALITTPTIKKQNTPSRVANTPYRADSGSQSATTVGNRLNRFGSSSSRSTVKPRVVNRPNGVSVPSLTIRPVATDFEPTTVLIPTKPAPFINPNTRAYERKYTGPTTESSVDLIGDNNPLIEDLNIEALNARNKKIFDINSKKHTTLKPKMVTPLVQLTEDTAQQTINTENENDEDYQSSVSGLSTITTTITTNTTTQEQQEQHEHEQEQHEQEQHEQEQHEQEQHEQEQQEHEHEQEQEQSTTQDNTNIGTQDTQDENLSNPNNLNEISSQAGYTTTPTPSTTLLHIFTIADAGEHVTRNPLEDGYQVVPRLIIERNKPKHKVVEINRIVEVNSKEEKLRRKSKGDIAIPVEGSETFKVESLPHIEQLGEISVVKYVHQVDGSDITIEGRSTVTDYTPTEPTVPDTPQPMRHNLPDGSGVEERSGKALLPEVLREAIETSTISLEGLFESARKGKVLNTVEEVTVDPAQIETTTEKSTTPAANFAEDSNINSFSILNSVAFDKAKINFEIDSEETENVGSKKSVESSSSTVTTTLASGEQQQPVESTTLPELTTTTTTTTVPVAELLNVETSTIAKEESKATTVAAALFPQYVRPIVPLLRPESNESSPLVISIANLDKVILSKVRKMVNGVEVEEDEQQQQQQQQPQQQQIENNIIPDPQTVTPEILTTTNTNTNTILSNSHSTDHETQTETETIHQHDSVINDSNGAFSSRLASVIKAPLLNALTQKEIQKNSQKSVIKNPLDKVETVTQTELYTINEGSVGSSTSSTIGSKISEIVSFSSETTVVRRKQPRKAKSKKLNHATSYTTIQPATES